MVYRPLFEAVDNDGNILRYAGKTWVSPKPHDDGEIVDGLVDWAGGEIRSVGMIEWSKAFGRSFAWFGGIFFVLGSIYILWKRKNSALTK